LGSRQEETFGPVVPLIRVPNDIDAIIEISNSTAFGLSSGVCTDRLDHITRFIEDLHVGTVNVWEVPGFHIEMSPFGGIKDSGRGYKRHQGFGSRLQRGRRRGHEVVHQRQNLLPALAGLTAPSWRLPPSTN
jgi:acyl-CoA reductase-like NAD-dependent aldehyde dehydrogenase